MDQQLLLAFMAAGLFIAGLTYATAGVILGFLEGTVQARRMAPDPTLTTILFVLVLVGTINVLAPLIVYFMTDSWFRMVVNAGTRDKDLAWIRQQAQAFGIDVSERKELAMIAVQGPKARNILARLTDVQLDSIKYYHFAQGSVAAVRRSAS